MTTSFSEETLTSVTYNIHHGEGNDGRISLTRIAEAIAGLEPQVVSLQENDIANERTDFVNQPQIIAQQVSALTGQEWVALEAPAIEFSGGEYGNAIIYDDDTLDLKAFENVLLPGNPEGDGRRSAGIATFELGDTSFQFVATHFTNLNEPTEGDSTIQLDSLNIINNSVSDDLSVILAGDLNADLNPVFRLTNGEEGQLVENNPETIETLQELSWEVVSPFDDESDTVPSADFDGVIDYIAIKNGDDFEVESSQIVENDLTDFSSDHYPVAVTFSLPDELDVLAGSLNKLIGFRNGSYFIDVPEGQINEFFQWNSDYPDLISAHRGGFTIGFPENALATFENTLTVAPALLEVDVRRTADGEWILMHDEDLSRTTNGTGLVSETNLAEIETLQIKDNEGNLTPYPVPTLEESLIWADGRTILELDLKSDDFTDEVVEIISELDAEEQVRFITDSVEQATQIYNQNSEIHLGVFIVPDNQETVLAEIEAAPFGLEQVSAFTGTQPQPAEFYEELHEQGIVAIQGLFGEQEFFDGTPVDELTDEQRELLFETVYVRGGDAIAADYYQQIAEIIGYPVEEELEILLVNDDGFEAEGINVLYDGLIEAGYNVTLVAPKEQQSGRGTLIDVDSILQPTEVVKFAESQWYVDGSPVTTTLAGLDYILGGEEPDLVISGINEGANIGENIVISSGTVSAATTATRRDIPAIAVSAGGDTEEELNAVYETGTEFVLDLIEELQETQESGEELLPGGVGLNVNIPGTFAEGVDGIQGVALTELDETSNVDFSFRELPEGSGKGAGILLDFNENISPDEIEDETSEGENFLAGNITVTPIDGSWVADASVREAIESRLANAPDDAEAEPLDILLTNDDGFEAEGIEVIYNTLTAAGHNVTLVAPQEQQSGTGTAFDVDAILQTTKVVNFEENKWYVDAGVRTTTWAGLDFILEETPDLVISGINEGENIGAGGAVSSGTVSAAGTALLRGVPAIAVSAGIDLEDEERTLTSEAYQVGADYIADLIAQLQATQGDDNTILPESTGLSINIPVSFPEGVEDIQGVAFTEPDEIEPFIIDFGELPEEFGEGAGLRFFPFELPPDAAVDPVSEGGQFLSGFVTITVLDGNWTADEGVFPEIRARLAALITPEPDVPNFGTANDDVLEVSGSDSLMFAGDGNDLIDASLSSGNNRIYGGSGNNTLILGKQDHLFGGDGSDRFYVTSGGDNMITGGEGADQFWIVTAEFPATANTITDFEAGTNVLGIAGLGADFEQLEISDKQGSAAISLDGNDLVYLDGIKANSLIAADFAFNN